MLKISSIRKDSTNIGFKQGQSMSPDIEQKDLPKEIMKSCNMLESIFRSIKEAAQSSAFSEAQKNLDRAARELQYIDHLINQYYKEQGIESLGTPLHERATPNSNYLLRPDFHNPINDL